ncbi:2Fe-2S iron-sulfur cluster-binding protein [Breoghania sp.]|uniref:(2Fe-2S)-binding protein n=1 Tax=Breoghania sp. TaxID=2065378 RepID=UPI003204F700
MALVDVEAPVGVSFLLNGRPVHLDTSPAERLSHALCEHGGTKDVKVGCDAGDCDACTVLIDGVAVCSCTTALGQVEDATVETQADFVANDPQARQLAYAFQRHQAAQCGICTPGMMVSAVALLRENPAPEEVEVRDALGGVLCRCTGYRKIIDAVMDAGHTGADMRPDVAPGGVGTAKARIDG